MIATMKIAFIFMIFLFGFGVCQVEIEPRQEIQSRENSGCGSPQFANDQQCDDENNNAECKFDGGACCNNNIAGKVIYPK